MQWTAEWLVLVAASRRRVGGGGLARRPVLGAGGGGGGGEACRLGGGGGGGDALSGARMAKPAMTRRQAAEIATHRIRVHTVEEEAFTALTPRPR